VADRWGIEPDYEDHRGRRQRVPTATVAALRRAMEARRGGELAGEQDGAAVGAGDGRDTVVVEVGSRPAVGPGLLQLEDGGELAVDRRLPVEAPLGYHTLTDDRGPRSLIVSPGRCHLPGDLRMWGWAVQLYASRSQASWGMGDLVDLAAIATWARRQGAGMLVVNPLNAVAPAIPQQPSPYFPTSRRYRNPIYLRVEEVPGAAACTPDLDQLAVQGRRLNRSELVDRDRVWQLKRQALQMIWERSAVERHLRGSPFARWRDAQGSGLREFATWCVLAESHGARWRDWPAPLRHPGDAAVAEFAASHAEQVGFHEWLQWLTHLQLGAATNKLTVIHDLPVGVDPDGADAWAWQDLLAEGVSVGAPPDEFNPAGQDWGLPPFVPHRLAAAGYRPFAEAVRAAMAGGGGVRIDHVMGLFRLYWIPEGMGPGAGAYVRYPAEDLLAILALESHRAGAVVVGEDLGTVEEGVRPALAERGILGYRLLWFEADDPADWPRQSLASVTTHDLATVAGLWSGSDLAEQERLGVATNAAGTAAMRARLARRAGLTRGADDAQAVRGAYRLLGRAPSMLLCATLEDAVGERRRPNMPGVAGRANWSQSLPVGIEELPRQQLAGDVAAMLSRAVSRSGASEEKQR